MRYKACAAAGTLFAALVISSIGIEKTQAQSSKDFQAPGFDARFYFPPSNPRPDADTVGQAPSQQGPSSTRPLRQLFVSPAEAAPAQAQIPSVKDSAGADEAANPMTTPAVPPIKKPSHRATKVKAVRVVSGRASYYEHPGRTASGEKYNPNGLTAAHKTLPLGTRLRVVNLRNGKAVVLRVNDRAPPKMKFAIDLSRGSARAIGISRNEGVGRVAIFKMD